jgi:lipopolysaccharide transport system ATP-binding protein
MGGIQVTNLGKSYKQYFSRYARLKEWVLPHYKGHELKSVIEDVSFTLFPGDAVGVIGVNGAGKSTLLKMIVGTIKPTTGNVSVIGRISALLELGMGFHPDFTGRQNVFMAAQIQGLSQDEISNLLPEIESFAEIGDYIDQPVRTYSSGMQMRLAFAVATCKRPDILIVDEALSVGDAYFQHKSFNRIRKFKELGTTLLLVSHSGESIKTICNRALLLSKGRVVADGEPEGVLDLYNALLADHQDQKIVQVELSDGKKQTISGTGDAKVIKIEIYNTKGSPIKIINVGEVIELRVTAKAFKYIETLILGYGIKDRLGNVIFGTNTSLKNIPLHNVEPQTEIEFSFTFAANLGVGSFSIQTALVSSDTHLENNYEWKDMAHIFEVINTDHPPFTGTAWIDPEIKILNKRISHD